MVKSEQAKLKELRSIRDTVESIWVAIVLAFVLRAFVIEAFVIPTGSMAPRLMGRHIRLQCPTTGYEFAFGKARRPEGIGGVPVDPFAAGEVRCPNGGYPIPPVPPGTPHRRVSSGDRVLVMKYLYSFREPERWDVVVFKNPQNNRENYIKRLIGLPGETIEIVHGDIFRVPPGGKEPEICRKPRRAQDVMWQVLHDNDYPPDMETLRVLNERLMARNRLDIVVPPKWQGDAEDRWDLTKAGGRHFEFKGADDFTEIRFKAANRDYFLPHYGYNPRRNSRNPPVIVRGVDICGDLKLEFMFVPREPDVTIALMLAGNGHYFRAELSPDGQAKLFHRREGEADWASQPLVGKVPPLRIGRGYSLALTNVDYRATLWVDGQAVVQTTDADYGPDYKDIKDRLHRSEVLQQSRSDEAHQEELARLFPTPEVRIAARGGKCWLRHVRVMRDVYYTNQKLDPIGSGPLWDYARNQKEIRRLINTETNVYGQIKPRFQRWVGGANTYRVRGWGVAGRPIELADYPGLHDLDEFFVLGDNSPQSRDGRSWTQAAPTLRLRDDDGRALYKLGTVPRYNLIGKALWVYWPAGFGLPILEDLPIIPNVGRMRLIR